MTTTPVRVGAVDLGASSGRVMVGTIADGRIALTQTRRFANGSIPLPTREGERLFWDMLRLWDEVRESRGLPADPMQAFLDSDYLERVRAERVGGAAAGWGA